MDMQAVRDAHESVRLKVNAGALHNAHDIAEGGLAVALAECCIAGRIGATVRVPEDLDPFAEALGRAFVVSGPDRGTGPDWRSSVASAATSSSSMAS